MFPPTRRTTILLMPALLAACVAIGPKVPVTPAAGRSQAAFDEDRRACMTATDQQVQPIANRAATTALAGRQGAMTTTDLQRLYDASYGQCMAARSNLVAAAPSGPRFPSESLQNATDLTDPDSMSARQSVQDLLTGFARSCPGERIVVNVTDAPIASTSTIRLVALSTPYGGSCFGQPGQNTYLLAKRGPDWSRLLSAEPGSIDILPSSRGGYHEVRLNSLGQCTYRYAWNGSRYVQTSADHCMTATAQTLGELASAIRRDGSNAGTTEIACPATSSGRPLSRTETGTLFDGDPAQQMSLAPNGSKTGPGGSFFNTWRLQAGGNYTLACHYAEGPDLLLPLGPAAHTCQQDTKSFVCR